MFTNVLGNLFKNHMAMTLHLRTAHVKLPIFCGKEKCANKSLSSTDKWKSHQKNKHHIKIPRLQRIPEIYKIRSSIQI